MGSGWAHWRQPLWLAVLLSACAGEAMVQSPAPEAPPSVDFSAIEAKLKRNGTNQLRIHSLLGAPHAVGVAVEPNGVRYEEWVYYFNGVNGAGRLGKSTLEIKFDRQGVLRAYRWLEPKSS